MDKTDVMWSDVDQRAEIVAKGICSDFPLVMGLKVYPIPRGGVFASLAVRVGMVGQPWPIRLELVGDAEKADIYIDDLIDSGATRTHYQGLRRLPFYALFDKQKEGMEWWVFPWERVGGEGEGPEENIRRLIEYIGDDPNREGLRETPGRVIRSYTELFRGYGQRPEDVVKVFEEDSCDEMVVVKNVEFFSSCEHHMLPFFGKAHIAYVPDGRVVGVSKLVRLLEIFSRRLQIQERLCEQITGALDKFLRPKGSACVLEAKHLCMTSRGVGKQGSTMVTSSLTGVFREEGNMARQELLGMIR